MQPTIATPIARRSNDGSYQAVRLLEYRGGHISPDVLTKGDRAVAFPTEEAALEAARRWCAGLSRENLLRELDEEAADAE